MNSSGPLDLPRVALIAGPTASGKSALALTLAERLGGTIINADASQVYRDLRVVSARPGPEEEARAPHLLYGYRDAADACTAADWAVDAREAIAAIVVRGGLPILVGGTGLYLRTLLDGIAPVPPIPDEVRADVRALSTIDSAAALAREDPEMAARLHPNDIGRLQRALEVKRATSMSLARWRERREGGIADQVALAIMRVDPPLTELYARCDARVTAMMAGGAKAEVARLLDRHLDFTLPAMRAIGVPELAALLAGGLTRSEAVARWQQATRNYAKRQRTWFRHQPFPTSAWQLS